MYQKEILGYLEFPFYSLHHHQMAVRASLMYDFTPY